MGDRNLQEIEPNRRAANEREQRMREEASKQIEEIHKWIRDSNEEFHRSNVDTLPLTGKF
jgi:hypothetical protein